MASTSLSSSSRSYSTGSDDASSVVISADHSSDDPSDATPEPDVLGIYTGPEADAVLARSHSHWGKAVRAARNTPPATFPAHVFNLEGLLQRIPALPDSIPPELGSIQGYSTWENADVSCPLRMKKELNPSVPHGFGLRAPAPYTVSTSTSTNFYAWDGTDNNGIALLILGWAYILSSTLAESKGLPLTVVQVQNISRPPTPPVSIPVDLRYARSKEFEWWKTLITPGISISIGDSPGSFSPWSLVIEDLAGLKLIGRCAQTTSPHLPSARQAAGYLARLCSAYNLGNQSSAALAAALCFRIHRRSRRLSVPKLRLVLSRLPGSTRPSDKPTVPSEFNHLRYYMTLGLSHHALPVLLESIFWDPSVPCNHAGQWLRPIRMILDPIVTSGDRELLAKTIANASLKVSPLWLGVLLCGDYPYLLNIMDWYHWNSRSTVDVAAWTGIPRSFLSLQPTGPHLEGGHVTRSNVWRLRRDLKDRYEEEDYSLEPFGPFCPFGSMQVADIDLELRDHLQCSHQWVYQNWTWLHNSATDTGFRPTNTPIREDGWPSRQYPLAYVSQCVEKYSSSEDIAAIQRVSRTSTEWTFKWSEDQVEKGFTGQVVPPCDSPSDVPLSGDGEESERGSAGTSRCTAEPVSVQSWLDGLPTSRHIPRSPVWPSS